MVPGEIFSRDFVVNDETYHGFMNVFNDRNPLHTDNQFAHEKGFPYPVMHGNILCGFLSYFIGECLPVKNVIIHSQEIKYFNPVFLNTKLLFTAKIADVVESVKVVIFEFMFENESRKRVAKGKFQIGII